MKRKNLVYRWFERYGWKAIFLVYACWIAVVGVFVGVMFGITAIFG